MTSRFTNCMDQGCTNCMDQGCRLWSPGWWSVLALGFLWFVGAGCSTRPHDNGERRWAQRKKMSARQRQIQEARLSLLSVARSHHRRATLYAQRKQHKAALAELDAILALPVASDFVAGREAVLDAWGRKAMLLMQLGRLERARQVIDQALKRYQHTRASFYLAQLFHIQGQILEKAMKIEPALQAYQRSIEMNKAVIARAQALLSRRAPPPARLDQESPSPPGLQRRPSPRRLPSSWPTSAPSTQQPTKPSNKRRLP